MDIWDELDENLLTWKKTRREISGILTWLEKIIQKAQYQIADIRYFFFQGS